MKRITMLFVFMWTVWGFAQAKRYAFSQTTGSYSEIADADGKVYGNSASDSQYFIDPAALLGGVSTSGTGFDIGFNFVYNGDTYNRFAISNDGWIALGNSAKTPAINMNISNSLAPLSSSLTPYSSTTAAADTELSSARIAALANDLVAQTGSSLLYKLQGTAPNRVLVVQWKNYRKKTNGDGDSFSFQIRLKETSNVVEIDYGNMMSNSSALGFQVGLRAEPSVTATNIANRTSAVGWLNSQSGTASDTMLLSDIYKPASGTTFTWTPGCGAAKTLTTSANTYITSSSAGIAWTNYTPAPSGYEYIVSASSALPTGTAPGTGTSVSTATGTATGLTAGTTYNVFVRSICSGVYAPWDLVGNFTTCSEVTTMVENFDNVTLNQMPNCWSKTGSTGTVSVYATGTTNAPASPTKKILISIGKNVGQYACAMMPSMSNLTAGNYQLRFTVAVGSTSANAALQVGYFTDSAATNFVQIQNASYTFPTVSTYQEIILPVTGITDNTIKNMVFRVPGNANVFSNVYITNINWEPVNACPNISALAYKLPTNNSVTVTWTKNGTETNWQYVYADASTVVNPNTMTAQNVTGSNITSQVITGLNANTKYNVWVRSVCPGSGYSNWVGPLAVQTLCDGVSALVENFDAYTSGVPACWTKVTGNVGVSTVTSGQPAAVSSLINKLWVNGYSGNPAVPTVAVVALPNLTNISQAGYRMKMNLAASDVSSTATKFEIGYMTDLLDLNSYQPLKNDITINPGVAANTYEPRTFSLPLAPAGSIMVFKAMGNAYFVDDLAWEPDPAGCPDVKNIGVVQVNDGSAVIKWQRANNGSETQWQYVLGSMTDTNPYLKTPLEFASVNTLTLDIDGYAKGTIQGLTAGAVYKVWVRANCDATHKGAFIGPYIINLTCSPVSDFSENFDSLAIAGSLPVCWTASGTGTVLTGTPSNSSGSYKAPSGSYILSLQSASGGKDALVAMPAVNNYNDGTHGISFLFRSDAAGATLELGFMTNPSDPSTFNPIQGAVFTASSGDFKSGVFNVPANYPGSSSILAFRNKGANPSSIQIDNVKWVTIPPCGNVDNLNVVAFTDKTISVSWTASASSETKWEYVIGESTVNDPLTLTPVAVTGSASAVISQLTQSSPLKPSTTYKVWVRSNCYDANNQLYVPGAFVGPVTVTTTCGAVDSFYEDFEEFPEGNFNFPNCWQKVGTQGGAMPLKPGYVILQNDPGYGIKRLCMFNDGKGAVVSMPAVTISSVDDHILKFKALALASHKTVEVGYLTVPNDPKTFVLKKSLALSEITPSQLFILDKNDLIINNNDFGGTAPTSVVLAFRNPNPNIAEDKSPYILIDNVSWEKAPTAAPDCPVPTVAKDVNCGNYANTISWPAVQSADGYRMSIGTTSGGHDIMDDNDLREALSTTFTGSANTTYYYTVSPYNYAGTNSCTEYSFKTAANNCYCVSNPTSMDGSGITGADLNGSHFTVAATPFYQDFTNTPVKVFNKDKADFKVTFNVGDQVVYKAAVWVDLNDDYQFSETEKLSSGMTDATTGVADAWFSIPPGTAIGIHNMRFASRYASDADPCYSGEKGETIDFKINVVEGSLGTENFDMMHFSVYPNPVKDFLNVSLDKNIDSLTIVNMLGQIVISQPVNGTKGSVDMSSLSAGAYLVKVIVGNETKMIKVVKQ